MHAAEYNGKKLQLINRTLRKPGSREILLNVSACGICGTDIKILEGKSASTPPVILGHEYCGIVEEIGTHVNNISVGDFVSVDPNIYCGECRFCRAGKINLCENLTALGVNIDGGFAEYCLVPAKQCYQIPATINPIHAALMEPLSCAIYGIQKANIQLGDSVAIIGGGMIGLLMLKLCWLSGAKQIILVETDKNRRAILQNSGADIVIDPNNEGLIRNFTEISNGGADVAIECVGSSAAVEQSYHLLKRGGRLVIFGVSPSNQHWLLSPYELFRNDITITGSFLNPFTFQTAVDLITAQKIRLADIDVKTFSLDRIQEAFENQIQRKSMKTVIDLNL
ncbi:MAG: zinc-dependent alcohol dehydrogenase family protein [Candidatus Marinimicrobia bacterium]|nr:zinc-dependent alcohol dehydrogenase family protein [Candidatus Neomarinimicrobiota bacterium]